MSGKRTLGGQVHTIRAAVLRKSGGPLRIETLEMEGPRDDEVLVRLVTSGICHTDIGFIDSFGGTDEPVVLGHEGVGVVEVVGKSVRGIRRGDHVVLSYQSCGHCRKCRSGRPAHCEHFWELNFGFARADGSNALAGSGVIGHFFAQSSFATHALATERNLVKVSKRLPLELLAPLGCGIQTGAGTVMNSLSVSRGESVAVFGTGAVGLAGVMAARIAGANPIIGVDIRPARLKLALELGVTHIVNSRRNDVAARISRITGSGVDHVLETTGDADMHRLAVQVLNTGRSMALIANPSGGGRLPGGRKAVEIIQGDAIPQQFIPRLIELYRKGLFPFNRLVKFYEFKDINRAIRDARRGATIKPVLRISKA